MNLTRNVQVVEQLHDLGGRVEKYRGNSVTFLKMWVRSFGVRERRDGGLNIRKCCVSNAADLEHASNGCAIITNHKCASLSQSECVFKARMFYLTGSSTNIFSTAPALLLMFAFDFQSSYVSYIIQKRSCSLRTKGNRPFYDMVKNRVIIM